MDALAPWSAHAGEAFGREPMPPSLKAWFRQSIFIYVEEYDLMI
ncbi:hypothetical protein CFT9_04181 [Pseudomonas sp. CFT9]|jgi:hypothetical protein|nr:hypothetical protein CFT9_04181 [Pseudomonas sp. CFT9]EPL07952.1 hypothetical protein CF150_23108 [Pseudomonas sp. CF150]